MTITAEQLSLFAFAGLTPEQLALFDEPLPIAESETSKRRLRCLPLNHPDRPRNRKASKPAIRKSVR